MIHSQHHLTSKTSAAAHINENSRPKLKRDSGRVAFPSKSALAKLRKSREFLNGSGDAGQAIGRIIATTGIHGNGTHQDTAATGMGPIA